MSDNSFMILSWQKCRKIIWRLQKEAKMLENCYRILEGGKCQKNNRFYKWAKMSENCFKILEGSKNVRKFFHDSQLAKMSES